jgi:hypothetical protein
MSGINLRLLPDMARPRRAGAPSAEPGAERASGTAQRCRLDPKTAQLGNESD